MRKLSAILSVSILILMSFSSIIQDRDELSTLEVKSNPENIASGLFHLVDDSIYDESVNAMDYDESGKLYYAGTLCGRSSADLSNAVECEFTSDTGSESTLSFAPAYVASMDNAGNRVEAHLFHSGYGDRIDDLIVLENGDILVAGGFCWLSNECYLQGDNLLLEAPGTNLDAFVLRMTSSGQVIWSRAFWSAGNDVIHSLDEGPNGEIYFQGTFCADTGSDCRLNSVQGVQGPLTKGDADIFFGKLDSDGSLQWVKNLGSSTNDHDLGGGYWSLQQMGIVATSDGGVIITGSVCHDSSWLDTCSFRLSPDDEITGQDGFVAKYSANGTYQWYELVGGSAVDFLQVTVPIDQSRILVGGNHYSANFSVTGYNVNNSGSSDAWWAIFNHENKEWEGLWDSDETGDAYIHSASVGPDGQIIVAGSGCWQTTPCTIEVAGKTHNGRTYGIGWALKVDETGISEWMKGVYSTTRSASPVTQVIHNEFGDIAMSIPNCYSDENDADCNFRMGEQTFNSVNNGTLVRVIISDYDRDGLPNQLDDCPMGDEGWTSDSTTDYDADGCNDLTEDLDDDNDGWLDSEEIACSHSPTDTSSMPTDSDEDGVCDNNDNDDDGDGYLDVEDAFPYNSEEWSDNDMDGIGDNLDMDDDNDDWDDYQDAFSKDACAYLDSDGDGRPDSFVIPNCPTNLEEDSDDDGDGVDDTVDAWPLDPAMGLDTDGDGLPNEHKSGLTGSIEEDTDDDNDGYLDSEDDFPLDSNHWLDTDSDGVDDKIDPDKDGDGWSNLDEEDCGTDSLDAEDWPTDSDNDGICDVMDKQGLSEIFSGGVGVAFALSIILILAAIAYTRKESMLGESISEIPPPPSLDEVMEVEVEEDSD
ncbi:MAG: hypothetical protein ACPHKZ_03840 [Candidatus Thalassarchaeaceae archaeon]